MIRAWSSNSPSGPESRITTACDCLVMLFAQFLRARSTLFLHLAAGLLAIVVSGAAPAATVLRGKVIDRVTGSSLIGAQVEAFQGSQSLGRAVIDDPAGGFVIAVEVGGGAQPVNLKLQATRAGYATGDEDVVIVSGNARPTSVEFGLRPTAVADCLSRLRSPWIVVGAFRAPPDVAGAAGGGGDFTRQVFDAVRTQLLLLAEISALAADRRPTVVACPGIDERDFLAAMARELRADALLAGGVARPPNRERFTVSMFLGDQHGLFPSALPITSRDVDLLDPAASRLDTQAMARLVEAVLVGYRKANRPDDCVALGRQAVRALRLGPNHELQPILAECERHLPAQGLRGGGR